MTFSYPLVINVVLFVSVLGRFLGFFLALPIFSSTTIPARFRVVFACMLTVVIMPVLPDFWRSSLTVGVSSLFGIVLIILTEVILGLVVALEVRLVMEVITFAGQQISRNMSFSMAIEFDPTMEEQSALISIFFSQAFIVILLIHNAHLELLNLAVLSIYKFPPGSFILGESVMITVMELSSYLFRTAIQLALPIMCIILFINLAMALITKFSQDFHVMMLAFPIRIGMGILLLVSISPFMVWKCSFLINKFLGHINNLILSGG